MAYTENGPRPGSRRGRARNTLANNASKATPAPPVPVGTALDTGVQMANLQNILAQQLAATQAQKGAIQGQFRMDRAAVKANKIAGMASAVNSSLERGIIGSSIDVAGRVGVEAEAAAGLQGALQAKVQGLLGLRSDRISALNDYYSGVFNVEAARAQAQAEAATQAFIEDLVMRMNDEQTPNMRDRGTPGPRDARRPGGPANYAANAYTAQREGTGTNVFAGMTQEAINSVMARVAQLLNLPTPGLVDGMNPMANGRRR